MPLVSCSKKLPLVAGIIIVSNRLYRVIPGKRKYVMAEKIKVGLLGYGYASKTFHAPLIMGTPGLELAGVSSSDASKVHAD